jgi:hypothetical protein
MISTARGELLMLSTHVRQANVLLDVRAIDEGQICRVAISGSTMKEQ